MIIRLPLEPGTNVTQVPDAGSPQARAANVPEQSRRPGGICCSSRPPVWAVPCTTTPAVLQPRDRVSGRALTRARPRPSALSTAGGTDRRAGQVRRLNPGPDRDGLPGMHAGSRRGRLGARHLMLVPGPAQRVGNALAGRGPRRALERPRTGLLAAPHRSDAAVAAASGTATSAAGRARRQLEAAGLIGPVPISEQVRSLPAAAVGHGGGDHGGDADRAGGGRARPGAHRSPLMLGRTYASMAHRRYLLRHHRHIGGVRG
jgi:hypothetical protein